MAGSPHLQRAFLLQEQDRHDQAEKELRQHLVAEPEDALAHAALALSLLDLKKLEAAEETAKKAVGLDPTLAFAFYALSRVFSERNRFVDAADAIAQAVQLEPVSADFRAMQAAIALNRGRWSEALEAAEEGLVFDAEHTGCNNLRAMALVKLGRRKEAGATIEDALAREPGNALTHANQGWVLLERGRRKDAMAHLQESLRLDPTNDWARSGLVEAIKSGNPIYALFLKYLLWMQRLSPQARWGVLLGGYFGHKILRTVSQQNPALGPWLLPIQVAYISFALLTWLAVPVFNLLLFLHPFGKHALTQAQRWQAITTGLCLGGALISLATAILARFDSPALLAAVVFALLAIPVSAVFNCDEGWPRVTMGALAGLLAAIGLAVVGMFLFGAFKAGGSLFGLFALGVFLSQFAANALIRVRPRK